MLKKIILTILLSPSLALASSNYAEGSTSALPNLISNIFTWSLRIGALIAFGALVFGGLRYIASGGNKQAVTQARSYIGGALLGLALLAGSFLLLQTINPALVDGDPTPMKNNSGICFFNEDGGQGRYLCTSDDLKNMSFFEAKSMKFGSKRKELRGIYIFKEKNWKGQKEYIGNTSENSGQVSLPFEPKSIYFYWETPGIYLYKKTGLEKAFPDEPPFQIHKSDTSQLEPYSGNVRSIAFHNTCEKRNDELVHPLEFGAILHTKDEQEGECAIAFGRFLDISPILVANRCNPRVIGDLSSGGSTLRHSIGYNVNSLTAFNYAFEGHSSGKVTFYDQINQAGESFTVTSDDIKDHSARSIGHYWEGSPEEIDKVLSLKVDGNYIVVLTTGSGLSGRCEVFKNTTDNLKGSYILPKAFPTRKVQSIAIIPVK